MKTALQKVCRGDVFYINPDGKLDVYGHMQSPTRPAVIISNEANNLYAPTVEIVYLTSKKKRWMPTHVNVIVSGRKNTVLCEQIMTIDRQLLGQYICHLTEYEMKEVSTSLAISIGL